MRRACVSVRIRLLPLRRDGSSRVLIGAAGMRLSDWRRRNVGALLGQSACRHLALARETIDSMRAGLATTISTPWDHCCVALLAKCTRLPQVAATQLFFFLFARRGTSKGARYKEPLDRLKTLQSFSQWPTLNNFNQMHTRATLLSSAKNQRFQLL